MAFGRHEVYKVYKVCKVYRVYEACEVYKVYKVYTVNKVWKLSEALPPPPPTSYPLLVGLIGMINSGRFFQNINYQLWTINYLMIIFELLIMNYR